MTAIGTEHLYTIQHTTTRQESTQQEDTVVVGSEQENETELQYRRDKEAQNRSQYLMGYYYNKGLVLAGNSNATNAYIVDQIRKLDAMVQLHKLDRASVVDVHRMILIYTERIQRTVKEEREDEIVSAIVRGKVGL